MAEYVYNPRRAPRAVIGCEANVVRASGSSFAGSVIDLGPTGLQLATPGPLAPGESIRLELRNRELPGATTLRGRVVWIEAQAPFRAGVELDPTCHDEASLLYGRLAAAHPDLVEVDELPERLPESARVVPWRREEDAAVLPGEEEVLLAIGSGARLGDLRASFGDRWESAVSPLFALLARKLVVIEQ
jgi:hypothetical protein